MSQSHENTTPGAQGSIAPTPTSESIKPSPPTEPETKNRRFMGARRLLGLIGLFGTPSRPWVVGDALKEQVTPDDDTVPILLSDDESHGSELPSGDELAHPSWASWDEDELTLPLPPPSLAPTRPSRRELKQAEKAASRRSAAEEAAKAYFGELVHWTQTDKIILDESPKKVRPGVAQPLREEVIPKGILPIIDEIRNLSHGGWIPPSVYAARGAVARIEQDSEQWLDNLRKEGTFRGVPIEKLNTNHIRLIGEQISCMMHQLASWKSTYPAAVEGKVDIGKLKTPTEKSIREKVVNIRQQMDYHKAILAILANKKYYTAEQGAELKAIHDKLKNERVQIARSNNISEKNTGAATAITDKYKAYFDQSWLTATVYFLNDKVKKATSSSTTVLGPSELTVLKSTIISDTLDQLLIQEFGDNPTTWTVQTSNDAILLRLALAEIFRDNIS